MDNFKKLLIKHHDKWARDNYNSYGAFIFLYLIQKRAENEEF